MCIANFDSHYKPARKIERNELENEKKSLWFTMNYLKYLNDQGPTAYREKKYMSS